MIKKTAVLTRVGILPAIAALCVTGSLVASAETPPAAAPAGTTNAAGRPAVAGAGDRSKLGGNAAGSSHERRTDPGGDSGSRTGNSSGRDGGHSGPDGDSLPDPAAGCTASGPGHHRGDDADRLAPAPAARARRSGYTASGAGHQRRLPRRRHSTCRCTAAPAPASPRHPPLARLPPLRLPQP